MWLGIAIAIEVLWAVGALNSLGLLPKDIAKHFADPGWRVRAFAWLGIVIAIVILVFSDSNSIWSGLWPELLGIGFGVLGIDELNRRRSAQEYKQSIIRQMASFSNDFALEAARIAKVEGWLEDGSFKGANLLRANLTEADLQHAKLEGADLKDAKLQGVVLEYANLTEAWLENVHLEGAKLAGVNLSGVFLENAHLDRADLPGADLTGAALAQADFAYTDLRGAKLSGADIALTGFSGVLYDNETEWPEWCDPTKWPETINWDEVSWEEKTGWEMKYRPDKFR